MEQKVDLPKEILCSNMLIGIANAITYNSKIPEPQNHIELQHRELFELNASNANFELLKHVYACDLYKIVAKSGEARAQYELGQCLLRGRDAVTKDVKQGMAYITKAATNNDNSGKSGYGKAQMLLAHYYMVGRPFGHVQVNHVEAVFWLRKAAEQGLVRAQTIIATKYLLEGNHGIAKEEKTAIAYLRSAAEKSNHVHAQLALGDCYAKGLVVLLDEQKASEWYRRAAKQGVSKVSVAAQYKLGMLIMKNHKEPWVDTSEGVAMLISAASFGHVLAQFEMGMYYNKPGTGGVAVDEQKSMVYFRDAANKKHPKAALIYGKHLLSKNERDYVAIDYLEIAEYFGKMDEACLIAGDFYVKNRSPIALRWYERAAHRGNAQAQYSLGRAHFSEIIERFDGYYKRDEDVGAGWLEKAAEQGHREAQVRLAQYYARSKDVDRRTKYVYWYKKAAEQDSAHACSILFRNYQRDNNVVEAERWRSRAEELGDKMSARYVYSVELNAFVFKK